MKIMENYNKLDLNVKGIEIIFSNCFICLPIKYIEFSYKGVRAFSSSLIDKNSNKIKFIEYVFVANIDLDFTKKVLMYRGLKQSNNKKNKMEEITLFEALVNRKYRVKKIILRSDISQMLDIYQSESSIGNNQEVSIKNNKLILSVLKKGNYFSEVNEVMSNGI